MRMKNCEFRRGSSQYVGVQNEEEEPEPEAGTIVDKALAAGAAATHLPKSTLATVAAQVTLDSSRVLRNSQSLNGQAIASPRPDPVNCMH